MGRPGLNLLLPNVTSWSGKARGFVWHDAADIDVALVVEHRQTADKVEAMRKDLLRAGWSAAVCPAITTQMDSRHLEAQAIIGSNLMHRNLLLSSRQQNPRTRPAKVPAKCQRLKMENRTTAQTTVSKLNVPN